MAVNIATVMTGLANRLETIAGLRVYAHPSDSTSIPAAVIGYPERVTFDSTFARGVDEVEFDVWVVLGAASDRAVASELAGYMSGSGTTSVKAAIEGDKTLGGAASTLRVTEARVEEYESAGVPYVGARFTVQVYA